MVLEERPDSPLRPEMLFLAGQLHRDLDETGKARDRWSQLLREFPDDEFGRRAERALRSLEGGSTAATETEEEGA